MKTWIFSLFAAALLFSACKSDKSKISDLLETVDTVKLIDYGVVTNSETFVTGTTGIKIFTDIIHLKNENQPYSKMFREIEYYSKGKLLLKVSESKGGISYTFNDETYSEKISYRAGMYHSDGP